MSERAHAEAWKTAITVEVDPWAAYDFGDVPAPLMDGVATPPPQYVAITVTQRFGSPLRMCGARPLYGWRLTTTYAGRTKNEARWMRERINRLADQRLDAISAEPLRFESESEPEKDVDGVWTGVTLWTYAAPYIQT
jgi:hypothetical protein